jgi:hypothetical protein
MDAMSNATLERFQELLDTLRNAKPNDRSEADRYYAIVITEVEKSKAVYMAYCQSEPGE